MKALRCPRELHAVGDETGTIRRLCRSCTRHWPADPNYDVAVYHLWQFADGHWLECDDLIEHRPKG